MKRLLLGVLVTSVVACGKHEQPNFQYMPNMVYSPAFKAQEVGSMRPPVAGTIPRGYEVYRFANAPEEAEKNLVNPLPKSGQSAMAYYKKGRDLYNVYCIVCHGPNGEGDGSIVPKFPRPPSLQSDKVRGFKDGRIYHIITAGQNLMPSYASQVEPMERWAIVHYVRALQRSQHPSPEDLEAAKKEDQGSR